MMEIDCAVRLVFQLDGGRQVGHIGVITDSDPEQGIYAELVTLADESGEEQDGFWLSHLDRGHAWEWLRDVTMRVSYLEGGGRGEEGEETGEEAAGELTHFEASILECSLDSFEVKAGFAEAPPD